MNLAVPDVVRARAAAVGATAWLDGLPELVAGLSREWRIEVGAAYPDGTEAYVARATREDGTPAVLKLQVPGDPDAPAHEVTVLRIAAGQGCAALLEHDAGRGAMLLERLGRSLVDLGLPAHARHEILCATGSRLWRPAPGAGLQTGAEKARWLRAAIVRLWEELDRPCAERTVQHALAVAERREARHDDGRAMLVHGDLHQWNTLEAVPGSGGPEFKLVDPDGLLADAEYDLGIVMREDPEDLLAGDPRERAHRLAALTGLDAVAVWEWGVVERVSTGLLGLRDGIRPIADRMLTVADRIAREFPAGV